MDSIATQLHQTILDKEKQWSGEMKQYCHGLQLQMTTWKEGKSQKRRKQYNAGITI